jgi:exopolysaccharide production protein ExoZ
LTAPAEQRTFASIQAMRGVAALAVVIGHLITMRYGMGIDPHIANTVLGVFRSGVDLFFVISGFIITLTASETGKAQGRAGVLTFAFRRIARIYPLYWIVLTLAVLSSYWIPLVGWENTSKTLTLDYVLLTVTGNWFVPPAWSLHYEVQFYATVALAMLMAPKRLIEILTVCAASLIAFDICTLPETTNFLNSSFTMEFCFGVIIAWLINLGFYRGWQLSLSLAVVLFYTGANFK